MPSSAVRDFLKHATDRCHRQVDSAFSRFDLSQETGVEAFLSAQAAALVPIEDALQAGPDGGAAALVSDWADKRRSHLLIGLDLDVPLLRMEPLACRGSLLGALYVLEGSKLGARFLLRRIVAGGRFGQAAALFLGHDAGGDRWSSVLFQLDRHFDHSLHHAAVSSAIASFQLFETAATLVADRQSRDAKNIVVSAPVGVQTSAPRATAVERSGVAAVSGGQR